MPSSRQCLCQPCSQWRRTRRTATRTSRPYRCRRRYRNRCPRLHRCPRRRRCLWSSKLLGSSSQCPPRRQALARRRGSVRCAGRFALELLRYGAPPDLVARAHEAALDEVRHAQLCFALASAFGGHPVSPGRLPLDSACSFSASLADFAEAVAREGALGETLAVVDAATRLVVVDDPAVRAALAKSSKTSRAMPPSAGPHCDGCCPSTWTARLGGACGRYS